jgi:5-methyltetrahydrofolate--homocysteine methyltransferase
LGDLKVSRLTESGRTLKGLLEERLLVLDGAMGTMLQAHNPTAADFGGAGLDNCNENFCRTHPEWILDIHRAYLEAGADIIETNSFQGSPIVLAEFKLEDKTHELNVLAAKLGRQAADEFSKKGRPRFVAGSMGPTTKSISLRGDVTFEQLRDSYYRQAKGLVEGGVDVLLIETAFDTRNLKAGILAVERLGRELGEEIPLMISFTVEPMGTMLAGQDVEALWASLQHVPALSMGLNCATGPEFMTDHIRTLHTLSNRFISFYPNAGLPNEEGKYGETPTSLAAQLERFVNQGWIIIIFWC